MPRNWIWTAGGRIRGSTGRPAPGLLPSPRRISRRCGTGSPGRWKSCWSIMPVWTQFWWRVLRKRAIPNWLFSGSGSICTCWTGLPTSGSSSAGFPSKPIPIDGTESTSWRRSPERCSTSCGNILHEPVAHREAALLENIRRSEYNLTEIPEIYGMMPWKRWEFVRISLLQTDVVAGDPEANRERMGEWIRKTVQKERPDVVVLPEMWNMGFLFSRLEKAADRGELPRWLSRVAAEHGIYLVAGSIAEEEAGGFYNASYMFDPDGRQIGHYRKIHLFRLLKEERYLKSGDQRCLFRIGDVTAGTIICYDLRFPELVRTLVLDGAQILFVPAGWPRPRIRHWRILNQARAVENQMFVVAVNRVGEEEGTLYGGHSMVVDPWGEILVEGAGEETVLTVEIDPSAALHVRKTIPVFEDRRPEMYGRV